MAQREEAMSRNVAQVERIMRAFAANTGLVVTGGGRGVLDPRRYLWTDAFAVCNFLELHRRTGNQEYATPTVAISLAWTIVFCPLCAEGRQGIAHTPRYTFRPECGVCE